MTKYKCPDCGLVRAYVGVPKVPPTCCGYVLLRVPDDTPVSVMDEDGGYLPLGP